MRKIVLFFLMFVLCAGLSLAQSEDSIILNSSLPESGEMSGAGNSAPVLDPLSTYQLAVGKETIVTVGASDSEGHKMALSATGINVKDVLITHDEPGRLEAMVVLFGQSEGKNDVKYSVRDEKGAITIATVPVTTVYNVDNQPIFFSALSHRAIKAETPTEINFFIYDEDPEDLTVLGTLPQGATLKTVENKPGFVSGQILWYPSRYQTGTYDIQLYASDTYYGRENSAVATLRVRVLAEKADAAPVFDPMSTHELEVGKETSVVIGASDASGKELALNVTGVNVKDVVITNQEPGRLEAIVVLFGLAEGTNEVKYSVRDAQGAMTTVTQPIATTYISFNKPIVFSNISHRIVKAETPLEINFFVTDEDQEDLALSGALPEGATLEVQEDSPGFVSGRILWYPSQYQTGLHDIHLLASDTYMDRKNSALATIRLKVNP